jgi:hypothetical protein
MEIITYKLEETWILNIKSTIRIREDQNTIRNILLDVDVFAYKEIINDIYAPKAAHPHPGFDSRVHLCTRWGYHAICTSTTACLCRDTHVPSTPPSIPATFPPAMSIARYTTSSSSL